MTNIQDWAGEEQYLEDFEDVWKNYREMVREGITTYSDAQIRNLFQALTLVQAHAEMRQSVLEAKRDKAKLDLTLHQSILLRKYPTGAMNKRLTDVMGDDEYQKILQDYNEKEDDVTIAKGSAVAARTAANALSRELSMRSKI